MLWINGGFDRAIHSLQVELLSDTQAVWLFHPAITRFDEVIMQTAAKRFVSLETKVPPCVMTKTRSVARSTKA